MDYVEALTWLYGLESRGVRLGLDRMNRAIDILRVPRDRLRVLHVAGTNGKGSACAFAESIAREAGIKVGRFSSPHLHRYVERVCIDSEPLGEFEAAARIAEVRRLSETAGGFPRLTFFEVTTLLALIAFIDHECDLVLLEVGLGGRLDSTNTIGTSASIITNIAIDHAHILGDSIEEIAYEKACIARAGVPLICGVDERPARDVITAHAKEVGAELALVGHAFESSEGFMRIGGRAFTDITLGLAGAHQFSNAACAAAAMLALEPALSDRVILKGLENATHPGRQETIATATRTAPEIVIDGAHNPDGCRTFARSLRRAPRAKRFRGVAKGKTVLLFGAMRDKDHDAMLKPFDDLVDARVYAVPDMPRAVDLETLPPIRPGAIAKSVKDGLARARSLAGPGGKVIVCGSLFLVAETRADVLGLVQDPPIGM